MYIDFHIHAYADEIADRAVQKLKDTANCNVYTNGRIDDTRQKLKEWGIDYGVLLPVATKPTQQTTINNWAKEQNHGNIISFGTVHPDSDELYSELERISSLGLHGVKLHPDYQGHFMFEPCMQRIYEKCGELGLPVILHMGYDPISSMTFHAMPETLPKWQRSILIAHLSGRIWAEWQTGSVCCIISRTQGTSILTRRTVQSICRTRCLWKCSGHTARTGYCSEATFRGAIRTMR